MERRRVVVTGLAGICALGSDKDTVWDALLEGRSGVARITYFDPSAFSTQIGAEAKAFDPLQFFSKPESRKMDRYTQMSAACADMAIKDSGLDLAQCDRTRIGCILGTGIGGINEMEEQKELLLQRGPSRVSPFLIPKMMPNAMSGVISIRHGLMGPNFVTGSACASAAHAIGTSFRSIQHGEADIVLTGGSEASITPLSLAGFCSLKALSSRNDDPAAASRPFDRDRDGFVMGEGSAVLVFEEYEHAKKRGARIYAEMKGYAATADAFHITAPKEDGEGPARAMELALKDAGLGREDIQYINAHGTSTPYNDVIETRAIKKTFGDHAFKLVVNSTKSMVGHLLGGSAAIEFMVTLLSISHGAVHPTINLENPDAECDLDYVPREAREVIVRNALCNSLGFGGHNATLVAGAL
jgi:3-oxoacyl-[acyl-carrier-protein] synthase II